MQMHALTLLCLLAAAVFNAIGYGFGVELAVATGFIGAMTLWVRLLHRRSGRSHEKAAAAN